jgi:signal transduction histidine kinase
MKKVQLLIFSILLLILSVVLNSYTRILSNQTSYEEKFEKELSRKCEIIHQLFARLNGTNNKNIGKIIAKADKEGIILLNYQNDSLTFWSSNRVPVDNILDTTLYNSKIISLSNAYYYIENDRTDSIYSIGLVNLVNNYSYENEFLHSGFNRSFQLPDSADMRFENDQGFPVYDEDGIYLFNIVLPEKIQSSDIQRIFAVIFLFIGLILLAWYAYLFLVRISDRGKRLTFCLAVVIPLVTFRLIQLKLLQGLGSYLLFDPYVYAESEFVPSLGDLLLNSLIVLFIALLIYRCIQFPTVSGRAYKLANTFLFIVYSIIFLIFFLYAHYFTNSLIFNSKILFQSYEIENFSLYSLLGIFINGINFFSAGLVLIRILKDATRNNHLETLILTFIPTSGFVLVALFLLMHYPIEWISVVFLYLMVLLLGYLVYRKADIANYTLQVVLVFLFSIYLLGIIIYKENEKESNIRSSLALSLANEHDPVAEYLFEDLSREIESDTSLIKRLSSRDIDVNELHSYLEKNYFAGFWSKYHVKITVCTPTDNVLIEVPDFQWFYCYGWFDAIINDIGINLPETRFTYLENMTGRISYLGRFPFELQEPFGEITLFIELDSKLSVNLLGYPELLLAKNFNKGQLLDRYSYAKYYKGKLVMQSGDFSYSLDTTLFGRSDQEFRKMKLDGYDHLLYSPKSDNLIVLSLPTIKFIDLVIGFSYIFLFYYVCLMLIVAYSNLIKPDFRFLKNLRSKIQFSIAGILVISLILIAASTIWISIRNYRKNQDKVLHEKIQSVLIELAHKLSFESYLSPDWHAENYDNLDQLLIKFSDVFYSDINLYDPQGELIASSRFEIFDLGLQGNKIDPVAFEKLHSERRAQFTHREKIGELSYLSAYAPFENADGKLLAYLNLPYFTKEREFQATLSALIMTIINIYLILILITVVASIFISNQITRPLEMLQQRFRQLKIGATHEQIFYRKKDEIGSLVEEYNKMVQELERSVDLLARSERESAWREMAQQIAHEIKNPLTPMRLSIQQLHKIWKDKKEDFEKYLEGFSATLIEQIDNLSAIASEFSNFAKMPDMKPVDTDIVDTVEKCVKLFEGSSAYSISFSTTNEKLILKSDKEQLSRALINIIKNAIQSIPEDRKGKIQVELEKTDKKVEIRISDNGRGIPAEIQPKMFMPNFTTKPGNSKKHR